METSLGRPSRALRAAVPIAFAVGLAWLAVELFADRWTAAGLQLDGMVVGPIVLAAGLAIAIGLVLRAWRAVDPEARRRRMDEVLLVPCVLAPIAVVAPWVIAPSHFGPSFGSLPFFVDWLTRYPSIGGVNHEVLLGIGAVLGACAMPSFFAFYVACARSPRPRWVALFVLLQLVAYAPVLVELDVTVLGYAMLVASDGPITLFGESEAAWWQDGVLAVSIASGALLRLFATASMLAFLGRVVPRRREPAPVWEIA